LFLIGSLARAEQEGSSSSPVVLVLLPGADLDFEGTRDAVEQELQVPVVAASDNRAAGARGTLIIAPLPERRLLFSFHPHIGGEIRRTLQLDESDDTTLTAIALLAGNLARDQTTEILEELLPEEGEPIEEPPPEEPIAPVVEPTPVSECEEPQCPPAPQCEECAPPPEEPDVRERSFLDRWALGFLVVETYTSDTVVTRFELVGNYRWGAFSLGLSGNMSHRPLCTQTQCVVLGQYAAVVEAEYRRRISRRGIVELGGAIGVGFHRLNGDEATAMEPTAVGRIQLSLIVPLAGAVDLVFRTQVTTTFVEVDFPDSHPDDFRDLWARVVLSPWEIGVGLGIRARF